MKRSLTLVALLLVSSLLSAQYKYEFNTVKENPITSVKNQAATGTCWCFATTSFLESEAIRKGTADTTLDLSEMYLVRNDYLNRLPDYYYRRGKGRLGPGAVSHIETKAMMRVGLMTEAAYNGINYDSKTHNHKALVKTLDSLLKGSIEAKSGVPMEQITVALDKWLGVPPTASEFKGKQLDPQALRKALKLDAAEYVEITSFAHHPFYERIPLEIPDNYDHELYYNVPLDELVSIMDEAIMNGFTIAWDADVSETYFGHNNHIAVFAPGEEIKKAKEVAHRYVEKPVDQAVRQAMFDNFTTTDDHLMHIYGIARDQEGVKYYMVKNSWGTGNGDGCFMASESYVKAKTIAIMIHKDALSKSLRKRLSIR